MDVLIEEEDSPYVVKEDPKSSWSITDPVSYLTEFLAVYGWLLVGLGLLGVYCMRWIRKRIDLMKDQFSEAEHHKDPDKEIARLEAIQRARERQQQILEEASRRALEQQKEKRMKATATTKTLLDDRLPLSGTSSTSSYRPPKRSKCSGGGCGR